MIFVLLISITIIALVAWLAFFLYEYLDAIIHTRYRDLFWDPRYKNMKRYCPEGCNRGECQYRKFCRHHFPGNEKCCAFDFQCKYCKDRVTDQIYKPQIDDPYIDRHYYTGKDIGKLNRHIKAENNYIKHNIKIFSNSLLSPIFINCFLPVCIKIC